MRIYCLGVNFKSVTEIIWWEMVPSSPSSEMHLGKFPDHTELQSWIVNFQTEVCSKAKNPMLALQHARFAVDQRNRSSQIAE